MSTTRCSAAVGTCAFVTKRRRPGCFATSSGAARSMRHTPPPRRQAIQVVQTLPLHCLSAAATQCWRARPASAATSARDGGPRRSEACAPTRKRHSPADNIVTRRRQLQRLQQQQLLLVESLLTKRPPCDRSTRRDTCPQRRQCICPSAELLGRVAGRHSLRSSILSANIEAAVFRFSCAVSRCALLTMLPCFSLASLPPYLATRAAESQRWRSSCTRWTCLRPAISCSHTLLEPA